ncbi:MAG TPA: tRNA (guanosine(37)-N1)-methyltransferase TrmD [Syntrophales bacterium]|jgi:tRNA (guanine37-N1)-methyltransferase|nr:tRNA (guanosine(37)-N1)-methyltransferase TrmD [Syntrophales bacterium]HPX56609.1 tRNA (guanosine(37)-N1)-methyltransferase TrmD [Syntrophales bacterium]
MIMIRFDILTVFPEMFTSPFQVSLLKKAQERGLIEIGVHNIRDHALDRHRMTDDAPYGGGCGMVMKVEPIDRALSSVRRINERSVVVLLTPQGECFSQLVAEELAAYSQIILICGHYEGVDERVRQHLSDREISIGDYVLTGGELSAMVVVDAVGRLIPGVLGNSESTLSESFSMGLLEYPQYTRPSEYRGWKVPDVLISGHHREIDRWRRRESLRRTLIRRPDLLKDADLSAEDKMILQTLTEEY